MDLSSSAIWSVTLVQWIYNLIKVLQSLQSLWNCCHLDVFRLIGASHTVPTCHIYWSLTNTRNENNPKRGLLIEIVYLLEEFMVQDILQCLKV